MGNRGAKNAQNRAAHNDSVKRSSNADFMDIVNMNQLIDMCEWEFARPTTSALVADSIQGFAAVRACQKDFKAAETFYEEALPLLKESFGRDHAVVAECLISAAHARLSIGRLGDTLREWKGQSLASKQKYKEALEYYTRALELYELYEGTDKPKHIVRCHSYIGETQLLLFDIDNALRSWTTAHSLCEALKPSPPEDLMSMATFGLGCATFAKGEASFQNSIGLLKSSLPGLRAAGNQKTMADCYVEIAKVYTAEDLREKAVYNLKKAVEIRETIFGVHEETADAIVLLAEALYSTGDYVESSTLSRQALQSYKDLLGEKNPKYGKMLSNIALALYSQPNKLDETMQFYEQALACFVESLGANHFVVGDTYNSMGSVRFAEKSTLEAMTFYEKALEIYVHFYGHENKSVAISYNNMGAVRRLENRLREAAELYKKALDIRSKVLGQDHKNTGLTMNALGEVELERKQYNEAMAMFTQARVIMAKSLGPDHPTVAKITSNMGEASHGRGQYAAAMRNFSQSLLIRKKHLGEDHPEFIATLRAMELVQKQMVVQMQKQEKEKLEKKKSRSEAHADKEEK